jgi:hypothetical protein
VRIPDLQSFFSRCSPMPGRMQKVCCIMNGFVQRLQLINDTIIDELYAR